MDYDLWKSGWYDAEPDINHDEYCSHNHKENGESLKELIEELHSSDELNLEFVQEQLEWLARDYGIDFDFTRPLCLSRGPMPSLTNQKKRRFLCHFKRYVALKAKLLRCVWTM